MNDIRERHRKEAALGCRAVLALVATLIGPLAALAAVVGFRLGLWTYEIAWGVLTLMVALPLTLIGAVAALIAVVMGISRPRIAGWAAVLAVIVSGATLAAFARVLLVPSNGAPDVSTWPEDTPSFSRELIAQGAIRTAPQAPADCQVEALPMQSAPGAAAYALQAAGFDILGAGVGRADGTKTSLWFGTTWDAVIRIRPGRTDVRVAARQPNQDRGEACRLAIRLVYELTPSS